MYQVQLIGAREVMNKMNFIAQALPELINLTLYSEGTRIVNELRNEFPGLNFVGQFFPESSEYWIFSNKQVICQLTGKRVDTKTESQVGRQRGKEVTPFAKELNLSDISSKYGSQIANAIEKIIGVYIV